MPLRPAWVQTYGAVIAKLAGTDVPLALLLGHVQHESAGKPTDRTKLDERIFSRAGIHRAAIKFIADSVIGSKSRAQLVSVLREQEILSVAISAVKIRLLNGG